jgi:hypothetical protein
MPNRPLVRRAALLLLTAFPALVPARALLAQPAPRVLEVPARFPTIQAAIDSARRGDTVLVAPGRYYENISFKGRNVVVTSRFARTGDLAEIERTIIDGSRPAHPDTGTVVRFTHQEDSTAVLQGFTITGGTGTVWLDAKDQIVFREGGGILCELAAPTIRFNHIVGNAAVSMDRGVKSAGGGGIRCGYAEPTIVNNVIRDNRGRYGAGVVLFYSAGTVRNNLVVGNTGGEDFGGGGLWIVGNLSRRLTTVVEHNTIVDNAATAPADSVRPGVMRGDGGGVITAGATVAFRNNIVWGNRQVGAGGQLARPPRGPVTLEGNLVQGPPPTAPTGGPSVPASTAEPRFTDTVRYQPAPGSPGADVGAYAGPFAARLIR